MTVTQSPLSNAEITEQIIVALFDLAVDRVLWE